MRIKLVSILATLAAMLATTSVQAIPINGSIYMGGEANFNSANTTVTSWPFVYVVADSGAFSSLPAFSLVNMSSPWTFSPQPGVPLNNLWSVGGFSFNFLGDTVTKSGNFLDIQGYGTISSSNPEYSTTDFTWNLDAQTGTCVDFIFAASTGTGGGGPGNSVPDRGLTLALLGAALVGVEIFRRKLCKA